jgi:hypothetical protein
MQCIQLNTAVVIDVPLLLDKLLLCTHAAYKQTSMVCDQQGDTYE